MKIAIKHFFVSGRESIQLQPMWYTFHLQERLDQTHQAESLSQKNCHSRGGDDCQEEVQGDRPPCSCAATSISPPLFWTIGQHPSDADTPEFVSVNHNHTQSCGGRTIAHGCGRPTNDQRAAQAAAAAAGLPGPADNHDDSCLGPEAIGSAAKAARVAAPTEPTDFCPIRPHPATACPITAGCSSTFTSPYQQR